jgi:UDP-N-acetylmuramoylalanine--D-glutamate ligase
MQKQVLANLIASDKLTVVVGLGATGLSVARFLDARGEAFVIVDSRAEPPGLVALRESMPLARVELGGFRADTLASADRLVVSPGISPNHPALVEAAAQGVPLVGDIELFMTEVKARGDTPVVAITGSNGKSTVTTLVGEMALAARKKVGIGGNLGLPALDLLSQAQDQERDLYVLELSSFQLELVSDLSADAVTVLNISPDHMDRYASVVEYHSAKHRIFRGANKVVVNRDDMLTQALVAPSVECFSYGLSKPDFNGFGLLEEDSESYLAYQFEPLLLVSELGIKGRHNVANALAALALGHAVGLPRKAMLQALREFTGLRHRCETVVGNLRSPAGEKSVTWINDSKATNCGATLAAITGLADAGEMNLILIAGGQGKGQDFSVLQSAAEGRVKLAILLGEDAAQIASCLPASTDILFANDMVAAVNLAARNATNGDLVLLSPACASFDMFAGFAERGDSFVAAVRALC